MTTNATTAEDRLAKFGIQSQRRQSSLSTRRSPMRRRSCFEMFWVKRPSLRASSLALRTFRSARRSNWRSSWK
jgi:hypothetical protein